MTMSDQERAEKAAAALCSGDQASQHLGMNVEAISPGCAVLAMTVDARHTNGHGTCHGGVIFTLADSAFAFACNSRNQATVAQHANVTFMAPAQVGDRLVATAREVTQRGRSGVYDVQVTNDAGSTIAEFRGLSRMVQGTLFDEA